MGFFDNFEPAGWLRDKIGGGGGGGGSSGQRPFGNYLPQNQPAYNPSSGGGGFADWLRNLPNAQQLAPMNTPLQKSGIGPDLTPAMWLAFAPQGKSLIDKSAIARMRGATNGIAGGRREFERGLLSAYQSAGLDPVFARARLAESRPQVGAQISQARGEIEANRLDEQFNFQGGLLNALAQALQTNRGMGLSAYFGGKGLEASKDAAKLAAISSGVGSLASLATLK